MKVRLLLDVDGLERYVIARYFAQHHGAAPRSRATREQVREFVARALETAVRDRARAATGRTAAGIRRLTNGQPVEEHAAGLRESEHQPTLW